LVVVVAGVVDWEREEKPPTSRNDSLVGLEAGGVKSEREKATNES
jgi:hypothetical protein